MGIISSDVYTATRPFTAPIDVVQDSEVSIELRFMDYTIPANATVIAYARGKYAQKTYKANCTVSGDTVILVPPDGFFVPGPNALQLDVNGSIIPFGVMVMCEERLSGKGDASTPEAVKPLLEQAKEAAAAAAQSEQNADASKKAAAASAQEAVTSKNTSVSAAGQASASAAAAKQSENAAAGYAGEAQQFANTAAGYAGAATVSIGWDADGYFSIFEQEE